MKKIISMALCLILIVTMLAACASKTETQGEEPVWTTGAAESTENVEESVDETTEGTKPQETTEALREETTAEETTTVEETTIPEETTPETQQTTTTTQVTVAVPEVDNDNALPWG